MAKTANIAMRIDPDIKEALEKAAKMDRRSVSSYIERLIADDLRKKGLIED